MKKIDHSPETTPAKANPTHSANTMKDFIFGFEYIKASEKSLVNQFGD